MEKCRNCGNPDPYTIWFTIDAMECDRCGTRGSYASVPDVYVPVGGMHFEGLSHPDHPESYGGTFCPDKATKAYYLKKYGLRESGDRHHGTNSFDPIAARHARESLQKPRRMLP